jgi:hypothetical protein
MCHIINPNAAPPPILAPWSYVLVCRLGIPASPGRQRQRGLRQLRDCQHKQVCWEGVIDPSNNACMLAGGGGSVTLQQCSHLYASIVHYAGMKCFDQDLLVPCRCSQAPCSSGNSSRSRCGCAGPAQQQQVAGVRRHASPARLSQWCSAPWNRSLELCARP